MDANYYRLLDYILRPEFADCVRIGVATNENDVLDEFLRTGNYRPLPSAETYKTSSPSMDISRASNFERFIFDGEEVL